MALEAPTWLYVMWSSWDSRASLRGEMILFGFLNFLEQYICPPPFIYVFFNQHARFGFCWWWWFLLLAGFCDVVAYHPAHN